jgi:hypothetical protein
MASVARQYQYRQNQGVVGSSIKLYMSLSEELINELADMSCSQDRARAIVYTAIENNYQDVITTANEIFGDLLDDYEYWQLNDKF